MEIRQQRKVHVVEARLGDVGRIQKCCCRVKSGVVGAQPELKPDGNMGG